MPSQVPAPDPFLRLRSGTPQPGPQASPRSPSRARGRRAGAASDGARACARRPRRPPARPKERRRRRPAACPSRSRPHRRRLRLVAGPGQVPSSPAPRGWTGREGGPAAAAGPPSCQLRGRPRGRGALTGWLVARVRAPSRRLWSSPGCPSGRRHRLAATSSPGPSRLRPSRPRSPSISAPRRVRASRRRPGRCVNHAEEDFTEGKRGKPSPGGT